MADVTPVCPMRVGATMVEAFRLYMDPEQEWMTKDALCAQIRGEFHTNPKIEIGLAFGDIVREPAKFAVRGGYLARGLSFDDQTMAKALELTQVPGSVFEAKQQKTYGDLVVASKADQLVGAMLREFKTTEYFDFSKYEESSQWRFMVDAFEPVAVEYLIFTVYDHENGVIEVRDANTFRLFPYAECHHDCEQLLEEFRAFVVLEGLDVELRRQQQKWGDKGVSGLLR